MLGAIAGDVIGSVYEHHVVKTEDFPQFHSHCRFTDDTVMTIAIAYAILESDDYALALKSFGRRYPNAGYGSAFREWIFEDDVRPYNSWGNGSAMRAAEVSHNHLEGIKGAQATALAVFLARQDKSKAEIRRHIA